MKQPTKESIVPLTKFRQQSAEIIKKVNEKGVPVILTQNGRAAAVLMDPDSYDELIFSAEKVQQAEIVAAIARGRTAAAKGEFREHERVMDDFDKWLSV